ncbi:hypothetical protein ACFRI7_26555 [Streptomyces sp. NPDC056716]|uniref:hypothetical protein n=1 Tax=unclassified Streptomyces TaxID=2593676 RepID=UPI0036D1B33B
MSADTTTTLEATALLALPSWDALTDAQTRGAVCVWDTTEQPLTTEAAVDLLLIRRHHAPPTSHRGKP